MNKERMLELADFIEKSETFDQSRIRHECGTPACIAGHAAVLFGISRDRWFYKTQVALELKSWQADELFRGFPFTPSPGESHESFTYADKHDAAATLRSAVETGEILWIRAHEKPVSRGS